MVNEIHPLQFFPSDTEEWGVNEAYRLALFIIGIRYARHANNIPGQFLNDQLKRIHKLFMDLEPEAGGIHPELVGQIAQMGYAIDRPIDALSPTGNMLDRPIEIYSTSRSKDPVVSVPPRIVPDGEDPMIYATSPIMCIINASAVG